jgi:hypothetical protein
MHARRGVGLQLSVDDLPPERTIFFLRGGFAIGMPAIGSPVGIKSRFGIKRLRPAAEVGFVLGDGRRGEKVSSLFMRMRA